jgi:hypothetical protein
MEETQGVNEAASMVSAGSVTRETGDATFLTVNDITFMLPSSMFNPVGMKRHGIIRKLNGIGGMPRITREFSVYMNNVLAADGQVFRGGSLELTLVPGRGQVLILRGFGWRMVPAHGRVTVGDLRGTAVEGEEIPPGEQAFLLIDGGREKVGIGDDFPVEPRQTIRFGYSPSRTSGSPAKTQ